MRGTAVGAVIGKKRTTSRSGFEKINHDCNEGIPHNGVRVIKTLLLPIPLAVIAIMSLWPTEPLIDSSLTGHDRRKQRLNVVSTKLCITAWYVTQRRPQKSSQRFPQEVSSGSGDQTSISLSKSLPKRLMSGFRNRYYAIARTRSTWGEHSAIVPSWSGLSGLFKR